MPGYDDSIASKAHGFVYGERAKTYGHPRMDFRIIAKVWSGLLQDVLKDGAEIDEYRVAVMMTGLKLARLVKSPSHSDSRIDTIGYMLTMERLDEVESEEASDEEHPKTPLKPPRLQDLTFSDGDTMLDKNNEWWIYRGCQAVWESDDLSLKFYGAFDALATGYAPLRIQTGRWRGVTVLRDGSLRHDGDE